MENPELKKSHREQSKLKAFKTIQKNFAMIGISAKLVTQSYPLNEKIFMGFLLFGSVTVFTSVYILNYAETFFEYTQSVYLACVAIFFTTELLISILKVDTLFEFMERADCMMNTSKWNF